MPVHKVPPSKTHPNGGYRWGNHGHIYPPTPEGKKLAERQGQAAYAHGYTGKEQPMVTTKVAVRKAGLPLMKGESVRDFTVSMSKSGRDFLYRKLNKTAKDTGIYVVEVYSDGAVFEVYGPVNPGPGDQAGCRFFAVKFNRTKDGTFDFTTMTEVKRSTAWVTKAGEPTTIQSLIFDKKKFKTAADAKGWIKKAKGKFHAATMRETPGEWRFRQIPPGKFQQDSFRTIQLTDGVQAVIGKLKPGVKKSAPEGWVAKSLWDDLL